MQEPQAYQSIKDVGQEHSAPSSNPSVIQSQVKDNEEWSLKEKLTLGALALLGVGGAVWLGLRTFKKVVANKEEQKSFEDGTPATFAKQIKMAFENDGWWGTNVTALRQTLTNIPTQEVWIQTLKSYEKLYSTPTTKAVLLKDLSDELQTTEYNEMLQIINTKPLKKGQATNGNVFKAWAKRLKAAFDKEYGFFGGTDAEAIVAALSEMPTQKAFINTGVEYNKLYGTNLIDDMKSESELGQYNEWITIIVKKQKG